MVADQVTKYSLIDNASSEIVYVSTLDVRIRSYQQYVKTLSIVWQ